VLLLAAVALTLRLVGLGRESFWLDETLTIDLARKEFREILADTGRRVHPPLYFLLMHAWIALGTQEWWVRLPSALAGTGTVPLLVLLGRRLCSFPVGLLAGLLLALSPLHIQVSQNARSYALLLLLVVGAAWYAVRYLQERRPPAALLYAALGLAASLTHYLGLLMWSALALLGLLLPATRAGRRTGAWLAWQVAGLGGLLPWAWWVRRRLRETGEDPLAALDWIGLTEGYPGLGALLRDFLSLGLGPYPALLPLALPLLAGIWLAGFLRYRGPTRGWHVGLALVLAPIAGILLVSLAKPLYHPRYLQVALPGFCLVLAAGLWAIPRRGRRWATAAVSALLTLSLADLYTARHHEDWRGLARFIQGEAQAGDLLVFSPGVYALPFRFYAGEEFTAVGAPPFREDPERAAEEPERLLGEYRRVWLVVSNPLLTDPEGRLEQLLTERLQPAGRWDFERVTAILYTAP
jgi:4-amino-4-deoxy-L-arabinose transferase-like glycosyltransferase